MDNIAKDIEILRKLAESQGLRIKELVAENKKLADEIDIWRASDADDSSGCEECGRD